MASSNAGNSATGRAEQCLSLLKEEMAIPSEPTLGIAGGPIDAGYVQNVIMESFLFANANDTSGETRVAVHDWAKDKLKHIGEVDNGLRDRLILVVGHTGDSSVVPQLISILANHPEGYMRFEAAMALYDTNDPSSIPALKHALETDIYARVRSGECLGSNLSRNEIVYSPTRDAAARALRRMGVSVPAGAEIVDRRYVIPNLEPLLYLNDMPFRELMFLASVGGPDAESAINRFIECRKDSEATSGIVEYARNMLEMSKAADLPQ